MIRTWLRWVAALSAVAILAYLAMAPRTGWLTRMHLRIAGSLVLVPVDLCRQELGVPYYSYVGDWVAAAWRRQEAAALARAAAQFHGDRDVAIAEAAERLRYGAAADRPGVTMTHAAEAALPLLARFPGDRVVCAAFVRASLSRSLELDYASAPGTVREVPRREAEIPPPTADQLRGFYAACAEGERLDPGNAFFPTCRGVVLAATGREQEASAAVLRAGRCSRFDDYTVDEVRGLVRLQQHATDDYTDLTRRYLSVQLGYPHLGKIRALAQWVATRAGAAERTGRVAEGVAIRHAMIEVGGRMRACASSMLGAAFGVHSTSAAIACPAGAPAAGKRSENRLVRQRLAREAYLRFLRGRGYSDEAAWVDRVLRENSLAESIDARSFDLLQWTSGWAPEHRLRTVCLLELTSLAWIAAIGLLAWLAMRGKRLREGVGIPAAMAWGIAIGLCSGGALGWFSWHGSIDLGSVALLVPVIAASWLSVRRAPVGFAHFLTGAFGTTLIIALLAWLARPTLAAAHQVVGIGFPPAACYLPLLAVPLVTLLLAMAGALRRVPVSVPVVRGWSSCAAFLALLQVAAYGVTVSRLVDLEADLARVHEARIIHQGRFAAAQLHMVWPDTVGGRR